MPADVYATVDEAFGLTIALSSAYAGAAVVLTGLFGVDGVNTGSDGSGTSLPFPVTMSEGADGVFSTSVLLSSVGVYFAEYTVNGQAFGPTIIRVVPSGFPTADVRVDSGIRLVAVTDGGATSIQLTMSDDEGVASGVGSDGADVVWPQAMTQVSGHPRCWYYDDTLSFNEGGTYQLSMLGNVGPTWTDTIRVWQAVQAVASHFDGWQPDAAYSPADWVSVSYIRRWTGWDAGTVANSVVKELRALAIETFIEATNRWYPAWAGTWYGLRPQGSRLYLPVPVLTAQDGASQPVLTYHEPNGEQIELAVVDSDNLVWRQRGRYTRQPFVELERLVSWRNEHAVKVDGSFGEFDPSSGQCPTKVKQAIVGLMRWHSLSYGVGVDEAREQSTANRTTSENSRDHSASFHERAIGQGLTGDATIDTLLAKMRIDPPPTAYNCG